MSKLRIIGIAAILSAAIATPALGKAGLQERGASASDHPNSALDLPSSTSAAGGETLAPFQHKGLYVDLRHPTKPPRH
jgi:hypothetical protein